MRPRTSGGRRDRVFLRDFFDKPSCLRYALKSIALDGVPRRANYGNIRRAGATSVRPKSQPMIGFVEPSKKLQKKGARGSIFFRAVSGGGGGTAPFDR